MIWYVHMPHISRFKEIISIFLNFQRFFLDICEVRIIKLQKKWQHVMFTEWAQKFITTKIKAKYKQINRVASTI